MFNSVASSEISLASSESVRRVANSPEQSTFADDEADVQRPMKGILFGALLGVAFWLLLIGIFVVL